MIEVRHLIKSYSAENGVWDVSFTVQPGEAVGLLGPNGAGKSTTLKAIAGLLKPTSGHIRVAGFDLATHPIEARSRLGYVPDHAHLFPTLTPAEYLSLVAELHHMPAEHARQRMEQMFVAFESLECADRPIETLSRGQKQKTLLQAALLHEPDVLLLDEPLNGLDVNAALTFRKVLERLLEKGRAILFSSHIFELVERLCSRILVIHQGKLVADAPTAELQQRTARGTLEAVFQQLTRREDTDTGVQAYLDALNRSAPTTPSGS